MNTAIMGLSDANAAHILNIIAQSRMRSGEYETILTPEIKEALKTSFLVDPVQKKSTEGDLAREALLLLSADEAFKPTLSALIEGPNEGRFSADPITLTVVITAALVILQIHAKFERDKDGNISFSFEKKPTKETILKPLIEKLLSLIP